MNEKDLLNLVNNYYINGDFLSAIKNYCIDKGKNEYEIQKLIIVLLHNPIYIQEFGNEAVENIIKENNIILIHDISGNYLTSYINQQHNGKEIH